VQLNWYLYFCARPPKTTISYTIKISILENYYVSIDKQLYVHVISIGVNKEKIVNTHLYIVYFVSSGVYCTHCMGNLKNRFYLTNKFINCKSYLCLLVFTSS